MAAAFAWAPVPPAAFIGAATAATALGAAATAFIGATATTAAVGITASSRTPFGNGAVSIQSNENLFYLTGCPESVEDGDSRGLK